MESSRYHSVILDEEKCKGCTNCIKNCPTEAIRVREGKARILTDRCLDCGECIRICENHAKIAVGDSLEDLTGYKYRIALPAPSLYGQFRSGVMPGRVNTALLRIGFNEVYEVAYAAEFTTYAIRKYISERLKSRDRESFPLISSSCPAVVRLIQLRFPGLIPNIVPIDPPYVTAAKMFYRNRFHLLGIPKEKVGLFFITPCPAKITEVKNKAEEDDYWVDGAIPISSIFGELKHSLNTLPLDDSILRTTGVGIGWARSGGENVAIKIENAMSVDGIHNVVNLLEEIEMNKLPEIDYIEAMACPEGCVGGALTVENPFVARVGIRKLAEQFKDNELRPEVLKLGRSLASESFFDNKEQLAAKLALQLDKDLGVAIKKMEKIEEIITTLPGLDCGACGSPTCRSLAEDIVQEQAQLTDCIILLRDELVDLAQELLILAQKRPPIMGETTKGEKE